MVNKKILIVDDEESIRNLLQLTLAEEGYEVQTATNGEEGVEKIKSEFFDVLLTDIKMPIMDGIELLKIARIFNPEIVAILITGFPSIETVREAHKVLAFDYIVKPFDPNTVLNCIGAGLKRRQITHELKEQALKPRILMVDDEPLITNLFEVSLRDKGYYIEVASTGKDAVEKFMFGDFNVVVTDIKMPDMDGITLLGNFKTVKPETIVIVITGHPSVDSAIESMRVGAYDYVTKPLDPDVVINVIERAWDKQSLELQKEELLRRLQDANLHLAETNEKLKELDKLKSHFISTVSHELRTPLTSIKGSIGIILNGVTGDISNEIKEFLNVCCRNTDRLIRLINDLLDIQKIEAGKFQLNKEEIDLVKLVEESLACLKYFASECNVALYKELPERACLYADKDRISQVLYNLISNGIKFSEGGRVTISILDSKNEITVTVSDRGVGIPADRLKNIFEKFTQIGGNTRNKRKGTGLGLSICKAVIEEHKGKIWVESQEGKGSQFYFTLPKEKVL
jgi:signal transduction histidine kinase